MSFCSVFSELRILTRTASYQAVTFEGNSKNIQSSRSNQSIHYQTEDIISELVRRINDPPR